MGNERLFFVTGGTRGIGEGIVRRLILDGYKVAFSYQSSKSLAEKLSEDTGALPVQMDLGDRDSAEKALDTITSHFSSSINGLINNAAMSQEKPFYTITDDDWSKMLNVNLQGAFILSQLLTPAMQDSKWGRIINITSIGGQWGGFNQVHYSASKAALINFTHSLSKLFSRDNVLSNSIAIGLVETDMTKNELSREDGKQKVSSIPMGRIGTASDIAGTVSFLISDAAAYITGQTININGGMLAS